MYQIPTFFVGMLAIPRESRQNEENPDKIMSGFEIRGNSMNAENKATANLIENLLKTHTEITVALVKSKLGEDSPTVDRAIQRILKRMIAAGSIRSLGQARARKYQRIELAPPAKNPLPTEPSDSTSNHFTKIKISKKSTRLLDYTLQPLEKRTRSKYELDFLESYIPNKSSYLDEAERRELIKIGIVQSEILPAGTYAKKILNRFITELSWNSSRLEGNTYSLLDTKNLIELGQRANSSSVTDAQMILNHKDAIEFIVDQASEKKVTFAEICQIHALLSENLLGNPSAEGQIRRIPVGIGLSKYEPLDNPLLIEKGLRLIVEKLNKIIDPFEQSIFALAQISYLQAFEDVNKRTSRIVANIPFIKNNLKPLSFDDVNQNDYFLALLGVYEKRDIALLKDLFIWSYKTSAEKYSAVQKSVGEPSAVYQQNKPLIQRIIQSIILEKISMTAAAKFITEQLIESDHDTQTQAALRQVIEEQLLSLHENNVAKFRVTPSQFKAWAVDSGN